MLGLAKDNLERGGGPYGTVRRNRPAQTQHDHRPDGRRRRGARHRTLRQPALRTRPGHGRRRARARGGPRVHLWLVLGGRCSPRPRCPRAPGPCARQQLGEPTRQERRARRPGPGRHVGPRAAGRGLDRAARGPRAARAGALPLFARPAPDQCQGPDPRGHGQERDPARRRRAVGTDRSGPTRPPRAPRGLRHAPRLAAQPARRLRGGHRRARRAHPRASSRPTPAIRPS